VTCTGCGHPISAHQTLSGECSGYSMAVGAPCSCQMFHGEQSAHARRTDPVTSHEAARSVKVTKGQQQVLLLLQRIGRAVTHEDLVSAAAAHPEVITLTPSGIRTRCHELAVAGKVVQDGETRTRSGRRALLWRLAD